MFLDTEQQGQPLQNAQEADLEMLPGRLTSGFLNFIETYSI